jgi:hypothetical protein
MTYLAILVLPSYVFCECLGSLLYFVSLKQPSFSSFWTAVLKLLKRRPKGPPSSLNLVQVYVVQKNNKNKNI